MFSHLQQYERPTSLTANVQFGKANIHPAILQLGLKFAEGQIVGANARCVETLQVFKKVFQDYVCPPHEHDLKRHLDSFIKPMISYLVQCRPMAVGMGNFIRYIRTEIGNIALETPEAEAKEMLIDKVDLYLKERILFADKGIADYGVTKICDGDVVLTYAKSSVVMTTLLEAHLKKKRFRVVVVDSRPKLEGRGLLSELVRAGIECSYILLNAVGYIMPEVSKVFLGAHCMFANGTILSRAGTAIVAMTAKLHNVPVLVCCETYKFSDRVQLDSFVFNELGDPDDLVGIDDEESKNLADWRDVPALKLLNLTYDVTPKEYIDVVVTEMGMIPCTSVPVVLRENALASAA